MADEILLATQHAAWAAQSAAEAAWWALAVGCASAIGTVGALFASIRLANRDERTIRSREAVFLMAVAQALDDVVYGLVDIAHGDDASRLENVGLVKTIWSDDRVFQRLEEIRLSDFPSVTSFKTFSTGRIQAAALRVRLEMFSGDRETAAIIANDVQALIGTMRQLEALAEARSASDQEDDLLAAPKSVL